MVTNLRIQSLGPDGIQAHPSSGTEIYSLFQPIVPEDKRHSSVSQTWTKAVALQILTG
jgi:hypothetical protein